MVYARATGLVRVPEATESRSRRRRCCARGSPRSTRCATPTLPAGAVVAIQGIGGLGHLGLQQAKQLGYRTVAIARGTDKAELATSLGADDYIDSSASDPAAALQELGGAALIVATAASRSLDVATAGGSGTARQAGGGRRRPGSDRSASGRPDLRGSLHNRQPDRARRSRTKTTWRSALSHGIKSMNEVMPFEDAPKAYERMMSGAARFRIVLDIASVDV